MAKLKIHLKPLKPYLPKSTRPIKYTMCGIPTTDKEGEKFFSGHYRIPPSRMTDDPDTVTCQICISIAERL